MTTRLGLFRVVGVLFVASIVFGLFAAPASRADTPNAEFGENGWIRQSTYDGPVDSRGYAVALQADGKIVAAGRRGEIVDETVIARYNVDGTPDTTFDGDGIAIVRLPGSGRPAAVAIQGDQKIVVAGESSSDDNDIAVARLNPDGSPDNSFGTDGVVIEDLGDHENIEDMVVQPDGKILVVGSSLSTQIFQIDALLVRYNPDGSRDNSFGTNGVVFSTGEANAVALQADNKIVVGGLDRESEVILVSRFNSDGSLDTTFDADGDSDGIVEVSFGAGAFPGLSDLVILPDQRIVTVGTSGDENGTNIHLLRIESDGSVDTTFDEGVDVNGRVDFEIPNSMAFPNSIAARGNGKVVIGGESDFEGDMSNPPAEEVFVAQINTDGTLDTAFDTDGVATVDITMDERDSLDAVVIDASDRIVAVGAAGNVVTNNDLAVLRLTTVGTLDTGFSGDGVALAMVTGPYESQFSRVAVQQDCKILAGGFTVTEDASRISLVRYNPDGSLDTSFGGTGIVLHSISADSSYVNGLALQPDGKILVADASITQNEASEAAIVRFLPDGSLDTGFGTGGTSLTDIEIDGADIWYDLLVLPDGRILATGVTDLHSARDLVVARFNSDGSMDSAFGVGGVYRTGSLAYGRGLALTSGGKYLVAGADNSSDVLVNVLRLNEDGTLDTSFGGGDGRASSNLEGSGGSQSNPMAVQDDDRILITGTIFGGSTLDLGVARFTAEGLPDSTFDGDGLAISDFGSYQEGRELRVQDDGKIMVAGYHNDTSVNTTFGIEQFMTVRYNIDGSLDTGYGNGGLSGFDYRGTESNPYAMAFGNGHVYLAGFVDDDFSALLDLEVADVQSGCQAEVLKTIVAMDDINSNGSPEIAAVVPGSTRVQVRDATTGALLSDINFGDDPASALVVTDDINGNGAPEIAILSTRPTGQVRVHVRDSLTGSLVTNIYYGAEFAAVDLAVVPDTNSNGIVELAVLGRNASGGLRVQARDALDGAPTSTTYYGDTAEPIDLHVLPDISGNGEPEVAVHARVIATGQSRAQIRDTASGALVSQVFFGSAYEPVHLAVIGDITGDGLPELAQLGRRSDTGAIRVRIKSSTGGPTISNAFLGSADYPVRVVGIGDANSNGSPDTAILFERSDGTAMVRIRDGATGAQINNIFMGSISNPAWLAVVDDLNGSGNPELAGLGDGPGVPRVQVRDSVSGVQISVVDYP